MKNLILAILALCLVIGAAQADVTVTPDPSATWVGYMTWYETPANGGGWIAGGVWGTADLRATFGANNYVILNPNTNTYDDNPTDSFWVDQTTLLGNKDLEGSFYREFPGLADQKVTFNYEVLADDLTAAGYHAQAFIKVLDPGAGWATVQETYLDLNVGIGSINLTVGSGSTLITQTGFSVKGLNVSGTSAEASLGVTIRIPGGTPALYPVPEVGIGYPASSTEVSWTNPDPNDLGGTVTAVAYLLESVIELTDPNLSPDDFDPGVVILTVDTPDYESAPVSLSADKYYYWAVHVTDSGTGTIPGTTWNFQTFDAAPVVDAGADQYLEVAASPMILTLNATVTDDYPGETYLWTDITAAGDKDPATTVLINSPTTEDTTVTLTNAGGVVSGYYQFTLTVTDTFTPTAQVTADSIAVGVYGTCAEAADADPDDPYDPTGDFDGNCKKDLADFATFAAMYLECDSLRIACP